MSPGLILLFVVIGAIAAVGLYASFRSEPKPAPLPAPVASTPRPQPAGAAPKGKVWSVEHGHWHDEAPPARTASPIEISPGARVPAPAPKPQPPGPAPEGKVWSAEHGHWHDVKAPS